jgi:Zn-dependent protease
MSLEAVNAFMQLVVFLLAISVHESAHAWMASRRGDQTARMLGRVTLNPIKHIDPIGSILLPVLCYFTHFPIFGWAKPTPVNTRNFKDPVLDDILTSVAGPVSNFMQAAIALIIMLLVSATSVTGKAMVQALAGYGSVLDTNSPLMPIVLLLFNGMMINMLLGIFNLFPIPPLDGSHVLRHFLPDGVRRVYDQLGMFALILMFAFGGPVLGAVFNPAMKILRRVLANQ